MIVSEQISKLLKQFSGQKKNQLKRKLNQFNAENQQQNNKFNVFLEKQMKLALQNIMSQGDIKKISQLIQLVCQVSKDQHEQNNFVSRNKPSVKKSLAILLVQNLLECLGINDLKEILPIISQKICSFKELQINDQNCLLRVINHLLKRISKTQDYLIRGQLQFSLTKILPICHDSGFHYRIPIAKGIQIIQEEQNDEFQSFNSEKITYQFYKDFWELQKFLMDPNELSISQNSKNIQQETPKKAQAPPRAQQTISMRLKHIQKVLNDLVVYMNTNPCLEVSNILNQPIKFLTNTNLLELQLSDIIFRKIILCQVLIFTFTLKHLKPNGNILKGIMLTQIERQIINRIQLLAHRYYDSIEKSNIHIQTEKQKKSFLDFMKVFFQNQIQWQQLKDHWKEKRKTFLRLEPIINEVPEIQKKNLKQNIDYGKKIFEVNQKIAQQMNIQGQNILKFLTEPCEPHIVTTPTQTSFGYYWSQAKSCLQSFNFEKSQQSEFESKNQYNVFEWKAMRSLYRQNLKQVCLGEKNSKLRQFKCLQYIDKKLRDFKERQSNPQKLVQNNTQHKDGSTQNIQTKQLNSQKQMTSQIISAQQPLNQQQQLEKYGQPKKKFKTQ